MVKLTEVYPFLTPQGVDLQQDAYRTSSSLRLIAFITLQNIPADTLPDEPYNGQITYLKYADPAITTVDHVIWAFQYDATESTVYKWKFIGGPAIGQQINTTEVPGLTGSYVDLATVGPSVDVPVAGLWQVGFGAFMGQDSNNQNVEMFAGVSPDGGTTPPADADAVKFGGSWFKTGANVGGNVYREISIATTGSTELRMQYKVNVNAADTVFSNRSLSLMPIALEAA